MRRFSPIVLACLAAAAFGPGCARPKPAAPVKPPLSAEEQKMQTAMAAELEQFKQRLAQGGKITDQNAVCMLYFYGAVGGDTALLDMLKKSGADINAANTENGEGALQLAVLEGSAAAAARLLERGADVNARNHQGKTALFDAAGADNAELVRLLLEKGADPNTLEQVYGTTPLLGAAMDDQLEIARLLLEHGADPNLGSQISGATPLHFAALRGRYEMARLLLKHGANPNTATKLGKTPLKTATDVKNAAMIELLKKHGAK